jgi:hypothetical protein
MKHSKGVKVFISYIKNDARAAARLYEDLKKAGVEPWFDEVSLLPGQKIHLAEKQAIRESRFFAALLSSDSVRQGQVIKQVNWALEVSDELPESEIHIIPIRLDDCEPPHERLSGLSAVDMFRDWDEGLRKLLGVIRPDSGAPMDANGSARSDSAPSASKSDAPPGPIKNRWALLVGVNRYTDLNFPTLKFCVNDVLALEKMLDRAGYTVKSLHDDAEGEHLSPIRENVEAELVRLCQAAEADDLLLVYFACHGKLSDGEALLITREIRQPTVKTRALSVAAVEGCMRGSKARRKFLILDACHTGVEMGRDITDPEFIKNVYETAEGFALIAASTAQQVAQEWREKEHGVFSYYLLEGLSGKADQLGKGFVTADDLKNHVLNELRKWSVAHGGLIQEPTARMDGMGDMIVADYRGCAGPKDKKEVPNPFGDILAIEDPDKFFDRNETLRRIFEELNKGSNISLVGESQVGKSSILYMIRALGPEKMNLPAEAFKYIDMQIIMDEEEFYEELCENFEIPSCRGRNLSRALSGKRYILCLDEIEKMNRKGFTFDVRTYLRGLACSVSSPLTLVIASRLTLDELFPDAPGMTSPLAGICMKMDVGPFTSDVARAFIEHRLKGTGVRFTNDEIEKLIQETGGHPANLQSLAAAIFRAYRLK